MPHVHSAFEFSSLLRLSVALRSAAVDPADAPARAKTNKGKKTEMLTCRRRNICFLAHFKKNRNNKFVCRFVE